MHNQNQNLIEIVIINPAYEDLQKILRRNPQIMHALLNKFYLLERSAFAGEKLAGELHGFRKLVVGRNQWRIVWRPLVRTDGTQVIEIAEVWGIGARKNSEVYEEVIARKNSLGDSPNHVALGLAISQLMPELSGVFEYRAPEPIPEWLIARLREQLGLTLDEVLEMDLSTAIQVWQMWTNRETK